MPEPKQHDWSCPSSCECNFAKQAPTEDDLKAAREAPETIKMDTRVKLWDAINDYTKACHGDPSKHVYGNVRRQEAVVAVETVVRSALHAEERIEVLEVEIAEQREAANKWFDRATTAEKARAEGRREADEAWKQKLDDVIEKDANGSGVLNPSHAKYGILDMVQAAEARLREAQAENERLRRGDFTPDEFQTLCHNLPEACTLEAFAEGCASYQRKLFGRALTLDPQEARIPPAVKP